MAYYLVTYDLKSPSQNYLRLWSELTRIGNRVCESSWAVSVDLTPVDLRNALQTLVDGNDRVFVAALSKGSWATFKAMEGGLKVLAPIT